MTSTSIYFQSFERVYQGVIGNSLEWKTDLQQLTDATKGAVKTDEMKCALVTSIEKLSEKELNTKKAKEALLSIFKGIDEVQAGLMVLKAPDVIGTELKQKVESAFAIRVPKNESKTPLSTGRNFEILKQIATQQQNREQTTDTGNLSLKMEKMNPFGVGAVKAILSEVQFKFAASVHEKGVENIKTLAVTVDKLNQNDAASLSFLELQSLLNEARAAMQTAQDIIIDLGKYDDLSTTQLKKQAQALKDDLDKIVESLSKQMSILINSPKCEKATNELTEKGTTEEQAQFNATIDLYLQTGERAVALVKVENALQNAKKALSQTAEHSNNPDIQKVAQAVQMTTIALDHTTKALDAFTDIAAAVPTAKKANPLLAKLKNAQKQLVDRSKEVVENPELKKALEVNPEAKKIFVESIQQPAEQAIVHVEEAVLAIDSPTKNIEFSERQKRFFALVQKTVTDESKLDLKLKTDISTLAQRAIPLMRIQEAHLLCKADSFSIVQMMIDYLTVLNYIYAKLEEAGQTSKEQIITLNVSMKNDGVHDLASFMSKEYFPDFLKLKTDVEALVGTELLEELLSKLEQANQMYGRCEALMKSE